MKAHCIYGPPGTGKTTELIRLINDVLERNPSAQIAFLSHTKVAAREAVSRGNCDLKPDNASTLHSLCYRLCGISRAQVVTMDRLREFGDEVGMPISGEAPDSERDLTEADMMMALYERSRARMVEPMEEYEQSDRPGSPREFKYLHESYENWKDSNGFVDFTDMLTAYFRMRTTHGFQVFFIDEFQDLTPLQRRVLYQMISSAQLVYAAGDDDQTIFEWSGADPQGMYEFEQRFEAKRKILDQSHRIPRSVHRLANEVIARVDNRVEKQYDPRDEEGEVLHESHMELLDFDEPMTVLYRDRSARAPFERFFTQSLIPYRTTVGWPSPLQTKAGRTIAKLHSLFSGEELSNRDKQLLRDRLTDRGVEALDKGKKIGPWSDLVKMNPSHSYYLDNVGHMEPRVTLSSIHSYKGAEDNTVVLSTGMAARTHANLSEKPNEEHRIFYVGVTRARRKLVVVEGDNSYDLRGVK